MCLKQTVLHALTKYSPITTTLLLIVFHGPIDALCKIPYKSANFMAKWSKNSWNSFTFEWTGFLHQRAVLPC